MGKASRVKYELRDSVELVDLVQTLKDVADNKFYTLINDKDQFRRFGESFSEFFRLISFTKEKHPLLSNDNPKVGIIVLTIEGSFLGQFNNSIIRKAIEQAEKNPSYQFIAIGDKALEPLSQISDDVKIFSGLEEKGYYEMALELKDYIVKEIMENRLGRAVICHSWPKSFEVQRPRVTRLLPCDDLIQKQGNFSEEFSNLIEESNPIEILGFLSNLWITTRLYEIIVDTTIASAAAQSSFLEERVEKMRKEVAKTKLRYRKARKGDIDKSLRETFSARMMVTE